MKASIILLWCSFIIIGFSTVLGQNKNNDKIKDSVHQVEQEKQSLTKAEIKVSSFIRDKIKELKSGQVQNEYTNEDSKKDKSGNKSKIDSEGRMHIKISFPKGTSKIIFEKIKDELENMNCNISNAFYPPKHIKWL